MLLLALQYGLPVGADETIPYDRNFEVRIAPKPAPALPKIDFSEEKALLDSLERELRKPIDPLLGPEVKPDISE